MVSSLGALFALYIDITLSSYASMTCYNGGYVNDWDGSFNNIQSSYFMSGVEESSYNHGNEDRRWKFRYCKPVHANPTWTATFAMSETLWNGPMDRDCASTNSHSAMIGGTSYHDNRKEDRQWTWHCGRLDTTKYLLTDCSDSGYLNAFYSTFNYRCPNNGVIRKIYNTDLLGDYQILPDRNWGFVCCRVQNAPTPSPTPDPTPAPTHIPTSAPTHNPTTAAPSKPGTITCGDHRIGAYNNEALSFTVRMPFLGELTFDASHSNFNITSMSAVFFPNIAIAGAHVNGVMTVHDVNIVGDYIFTIGGDDGVYDQFEVEVTCTSEHPTAAPTHAPTKTPTEAPTAAPSRNPTRVPTVNPTFAPTIAPSAGPTTSPMERLMVRPPSDLPTQTPVEVDREVGIQTTNYNVMQQTEAKKDADARPMKGTLATSWVVIILLVVLLAGSCVIVGIMLCRRKKRMTDETEETMEAMSSLQIGGEIAPGTNHGSTNIERTDALPPLPALRSTELVSMATNDGCAEGEKKDILETDSEEDSDLEDMFLKQKTTAQGKQTTENEENLLLVNGNAKDDENEFSSSDTDLAMNDLYSGKRMDTKAASK